LKANIAAVRRAQEQVDERIRHLRREQARVKPKDLVTLERARLLMDGSSGGRAMAVDVQPSASEEAHLQRRVSRLKNEQRALILDTDKLRTSVQRIRTELRIVQGELEPV